MASKRVLRLEKTENFINEDFSDMTLTKLDISKKLFKSCNFDRTHFVNLDFDSCIFIDCSFKNCNFYNIEINNSQIIRCDFRNSSFQDFSIENTFKSDNVFLNLDINSNVSGISEDETGISQNVIRIPEFVKSLEQSSGVNVNIPEDGVFTFEINSNDNNENITTKLILTNDSEKGENVLAIMVEINDIIILTNFVKLPKTVSELTKEISDTIVTAGKKIRVNSLEQVILKLLEVVNSDNLTNMQNVSVLF
jgi:hypothetical protein